MLDFRLSEMLLGMRKRVPQSRRCLSAMTERVRNIDNVYWDQGQGENLSSILDCILVAEDRLLLIENQLSKTENIYDKRVTTLYTRCSSLGNLISIIENRLRRAEVSVRSTKEQRVSNEYAASGSTASESLG